MIVTLRTERIRTLDDVRAFLEGSEAADITLHDRREAYAFIERTLVRFRYHFGLSRIGKGVVRRFLAKVTGYSPAQADPPHRAPAPHGRDPGPQATPSGPAFPNRLHAPPPRCWRRWTRPSASSPARQPRRSCGASTRSSGTSASRAWPGSPTATSTTCAGAGRTAAPGSRSGGPAALPPPSECAANPAPRVARASCASTPSTPATVTGRREYS